MSVTAIWRILLVVAVALLLLGNSSIWIDRSMADRDAFVETALEELEKEESRAAIAEDIVFALMGNQPLIYQLAGDTAEVAVTRILGTPAFQPLLTLIATDLHRMVVTGEQPILTLGPTFLPPIVAAIIAMIGPGPAFGFPGQQVDIELFSRQHIPSLENVIDPLQAVGLYCGIAGLVILFFAIVANADRARALRWVAIALFGTLVATLLAIYPFRAWYLGQIDDDTAHAITTGVLDAFTVDLIIQSIALLIAAIIVLIASVVLSRLTNRTLERQPVDA